MSERIVCLDGFTLNPGDISWQAFEQLGELVVYDRTAPEQTVERAQGAPYVLTNKTALTAQTLAALSELRYVGVLATGYNIVDVGAASAHGIVVSNVPTYGTDSVAQHVFALLFGMVRPVGLHETAVKRGEWTRCPDWCFSLAPIESLASKRLGLVGVGRIGLAVARIAQAMGMPVSGFDTHWPNEDVRSGLDIERLELDELFRRSDVISLHCPLTPETDRLVNTERLHTMKPSALLINTSRGPLIDNRALADALNAGTIAGAALDVLDVEPPPADNPLLDATNCLITPHIAWYARSSREKLMSIAADNLKSFQAGTPQNNVA
jgi:glycerate dehydrogenase